MYLSRWIVAVLLFVGLVWYVLVDGARLHPDRREVLVREVDNGYIVQFRTANNPYPVRESVASDTAEVAYLVKGYLGLPIPGPLWGK